MRLAFDPFQPYRKRLTIAAIGLIASLAVRSAFHKMHSHASRAVPLSGEQLYTRALTLSAKVYGPITLAGSSASIPSGDWDFVGRAGGARVQMILDKTGHICALGADLDPLSSAWRVAPLQTEAQAREVALHRLQELQVLPPQSRLTLMQPPQLIHTHSARLRWHLRWWVQSPPLRHPYPLSMSLDRSTGLPIYICRGATWRVRTRPGV